MVMALSAIFGLLLCVYVGMLVMRWQDHQIRLTEREMRAHGDSTPWTSPQHLRLMTWRPKVSLSRGRHRQRTVIKVVPRR